MQIPPADFLYVSGNIHTYLEYSQTLKQEIKELYIDYEFLFFWKFTIILTLITTGSGYTLSHLM